MTVTALPETIGPVTIRPTITAWRGDCGECPRDFLAADDVAARTMARQHWIVCHPDTEGAP